MSEQHYAPPESDITGSSANLSHLLTPLLATKPWVRLCSILGFVGSAFMLIAAISIMSLGGRASQAFGEMSGAATGIGIAYILLAILYIFPSLYLFKYASAIGRANQSQSVDDIAVALTQQKSFWKFAGIMALLMVIFMAIGIIMAIVKG